MVKVIKKKVEKAVVEKEVGAAVKKKVGGTKKAVKKKVVNKAGK